MELIHNSAKVLWKQALNHVLEQGTEYHDTRTFKEVLCLSTRLTGFEDITAPIESITQIKKWVYPSTKEIAEIILQGNLSRSFAYSYGERIFAYPDKKVINQIDEYIVPLLKQSPNSRRAIIGLWNPLKDTAFPQNAVPSMLNVDFKLREGELHIHAMIRSNDIFIGWPANMYQLFVLGNYVAKKLHCSLKSITTFSTSAHIYTEHIKDIKTIL